MRYLLLTAFVLWGLGTIRLQLDRWRARDTARRQKRDAGVSHGDACAAIDDEHFAVNDPTPRLTLSQGQVWVSAPDDSAAADLVLRSIAEHPPLTSAP